jgi:hypothetical protein
MKVATSKLKKQKRTALAMASPSGRFFTKSYTSGGLSKMARRFFSLLPTNLSMISGPLTIVTGLAAHGMEETGGEGIMMRTTTTDGNDAHHLLALTEVAIGRFPISAPPESFRSLHGKEKPPAIKNKSYE